LLKNPDIGKMANLKNPVYPTYPPERAEFPENVLLVTVRVPALLMPPPFPPMPSSIVIFSSVSTALG
jgi:hypothetical protein